MVDLRLRLSVAEQEVAGRSFAFEEALKLLGAEEGNEGVRKKLEDKLRKERESLDDLKAELANAMARLSGYKDVLRILEKETEEGAEPELRPGSELFKIRDAIRAMGQPLSLAQMLEVLGEQDNASKRNSVRGSVSRYAREGKIFVQTAVNTFGLLELGHRADQTPEPSPLDQV